MTTLSPAAQAVLDAFAASEGGIWLEGDPERLAAALREAINQYQNGQGVISAVDLYLIADELENQP